MNTILIHKEFIKGRTDLKYCDGCKIQCLMTKSEPSEIRIFLHYRTRYGSDPNYRTRYGSDTITARKLLKL